MSPPKPNVLIILTSQAEIPATRNQTGWYLSDLAHSHEILKDKVSLTLASPHGGDAPLDPSSITQSEHTDDVVATAFLAQSREIWAHTARIREMVVRAADFQALFEGRPGGVAMFDFVTDAFSLALVQTFAAAKKPVAAVGHASVALLNATAPSGVPLLAGTTVTGYSVEEEQAAGMADVVPFRLETELDRVSGGGYVKADRIWGEKVVVSTAAGTQSPVITGQNTASAAGVAREILRVLGV
ncbi:ThiJ/PfpI family protein [Aspergillus clavatus NRRL 1]|uniref:D-lactate dehydratase n=1 Tax=Aspergillus clavatus (strain ATCC 1007 / CBS 513.65 / DSM 816 / NCTC 3887 / NRRL 1 / QM 1276 / 107) TaxID=344612 RepID=A1CJW9_ASPCL|nr:DJ-1/PfpI family protein [Aspergillus clavatus NRRL 1]EAW09443.1 DJ-1/PfpI family protein [Aspergillus clavatus NRRL 1]